MSSTALRGVGIGNLAPGQGRLVLVSWVPDEDIPPEHRAWVARHVERAATMAGILGDVDVVWFAPASDGLGDIAIPADPDGRPPAGCTNQALPNTIGLLATLRGPIVAQTIAHELRHVLQQNQRALLEDAAWIERDCRDFAVAYMLAEPIDGAPAADEAPDP